MRDCIRKAIRWGSKAVEMALELPVLFFTVLGGIEVGRGAMVKNVLEEAARAGCRVAVLQDANRGDVINAVNRVLRAADIKVKDVAIQPADLSNLAPFENVAVTVSVPYRDVSLFAPDIMKNSQLSGVCVMPAEIEIDEDLNFPNPQTGKKNKKNRKNKKNTSGKQGKRIKSSRVSGCTST